VKAAQLHRAKPLHARLGQPHGADRVRRDVPQHSARFAPKGHETGAQPLERRRKHDSAGGEPQPDAERSNAMKSFLKWTALIVGLGAAGAFVVRAVQSGRKRLDEALGRAEAITDKTRAALEETQAAIHATRSAL
jgi:hypothetical protein